MLKISPISYIFSSFIILSIIILIFFPEYVLNNYFFLFGSFGMAVIVLFFLSRNIGILNAITIFLIAGLLGYLFEFIGVHYSFPFGQYEYTDFFQPQIFGVPIVIPMAWFTAVLTSFLFAQLLFNHFHKKTLFGTMMLAAFICVLYDMPIEYLATHEWKAWIWLDKGLIFGTPIMNFFGWFVVSIIIYLIAWSSWKKLKKQGKNYIDLQIILFIGYGYTLFHFLLILIK